MPVSNEDETGMAIRYVSINTEHHILLHIGHNYKGPYRAPKSEILMNV